MPVRLPSLNSLRAFEAVVRCGSLAAAAAELGVVGVRGAVRQHIGALEAVARGRAGAEQCVVPVPKEIDAAVADAYLALNR